jgi:chemotaxis protein methyltransferase WspC
LTPIEALIEARLGLSPRAVGPGVIDRAIGRRMAARGLTDRDAYAVYAGAHPGEWEALLEELVVLETWFFRVPEAFAELVRFARTRRNAGPDAPLRIVSLPCATGEEPYSIVMALLEAGFPPESFRVDAADVSARALCRAQAGVFGEGAFRGAPAPMRDRFFDKVATGYAIHRTVRDRIRFLRGNLLDPGLLDGAPPYDVVFCRNLVIYLSERARTRAAAAVDRLLAPGGLLFVGHAETDIFRGAGFVRTPAPRAFACRRSAAGHPKAATPPEPIGRPATDQPSGLKRRPGESRSPAEMVEAAPSADPAFSCPAPVNGQPDAPPPAPADSRATAAAAAPVSGPETCGQPGGPAQDPLPEDFLAEAGRLADGGDLAAALARCRDHLARHPADPKAHFLAGMIHQSRGEDAAAEAHFERTVYLDPAHHEALWQLAQGADRRGERPKADRFRARAKRVREREDAQ